jgi:uncharacterized membrane protein
MDTQFGFQLAYVLGTACIVYKLAFLIRQTAGLSLYMAMAFRIVCFTFGCAAAFRAFIVIDQGRPIEAVDLVMQLALCAVLIFTIVQVGRRQKVW